jgi:hypothetical protein
VPINLVAELDPGQAARKLDSGLEQLQTCAFLQDGLQQSG